MKPNVKDKIIPILIVVVIIGVIVYGVMQSKSKNEDNNSSEITTVTTTTTTAKTETQNQSTTTVPSQTKAPETTTTAIETTTIPKTEATPIDITTTDVVLFKQVAIGEDFIQYDPNTDDYANKIIRILDDKNLIIAIYASGVGSRCTYELTYDGIKLTGGYSIDDDGNETYFPFEEHREFSMEFKKVDDYYLMTFSSRGEYDEWLEAMPFRIITEEMGLGL